MPSRSKGVAQIRRLLKRLPENVRVEIAAALESSGRSILAAMRAKAPRRTGALAAGLKMKVFPRTLRLRVGFIATPRGRAKLFYARILEFGRRSQTVTVSRRRTGAAKRLVSGRKPAGDLVSVYQLRVRPLQGRRLVYGRYPELRRDLNSKLQRVFQRALGRIAGGRNA
nr:HK97 gp10 family phage protein [Sphingomonas sp. SFZ2018-12]